MNKANKQYNPQPQLSFPIDLPQDLFSQELWRNLRYIEPKHRITMIKMVYEELSTPLIYHWHLRVSGLARYDNYIAIRPILKRKDLPIHPLQPSGVSLPEYNSLNPTRSHYIEQHRDFLMRHHHD